IMMALPSIDENHPDYYALQVLNHIFGASGFGSRLMEEAREKRGLTYGIYSGLNNYDEAKALTISTSTQNKTAQEIISVIHNEMTKLHNDDLEEEIKKAKSYIIGSLPLSLTSTDNIASILTSLQLNDRPINYLDQYAEKINAVTKNDIQLLAKELLLPKELTTIIVGSPEKIENYEEIVEIPNVE
ncbi:MAG: insulinase family protein, partial [Pseudomonadota bacterium]